MAPILSVENLCTGYGKKQVVFNASLEVMRGEILVLTGGNGSGKSTLLKAIYGLLPAWNRDAEIVFRPAPNGLALNTRSPSLNLSKGLAYLPQKNGVFENLSADDNLRLAGYTLRDRHEFATRRDEVLTFLPTLHPLLRRKPEKMSGGERRVVALAMVLLHRPRLLLLDEPLTGLDSKNTEYLVQYLTDWRRRVGLTFLVVEQRLYEASRFGDRRISMRLGRIENSIRAQPYMIST